jgi:hypothetical protein
VLHSQAQNCDCIRNVCYLHPCAPCLVQTAVVNYGGPGSQGAKLCTHYGMFYSAEVRKPVVAATPSTGAAISIQGVVSTARVPCTLIVQWSSTVSSRGSYSALRYVLLYFEMVVDIHSWHRGLRFASSVSITWLYLALVETSGRQQPGAASS